MKTSTLLAILVLILIFIATFLILLNQLQEEEQKMEEETCTNNPLYQGPVPEGFNETHFRQTGRTILNDEIS